MGYDFSGLKGLAVDTDFMEAPLQAPKKPLKELNPLKAVNLPLVGQKTLEEPPANYKELLKECQDNIKRSEELRGAISKGLRKGEPAYTLLLKAVECISCMTGDGMYYNQTKKSIEAIYGEGCLEKVPLEWMLQGVQERLKRMEEAKKRGGEKDTIARIDEAIKAHKEEEKRLQGLLKKKYDI